MGRGTALAIGNLSLISSKGVSYFPRSSGKEYLSRAGEQLSYHWWCGAWMYRLLRYTAVMWSMPIVWLLERYVWYWSSCPEPR